MNHTELVKSFLRMGGALPTEPERVADDSAPHDVYYHNYSETTVFTFPDRASGIAFMDECARLHNLECDHKEKHWPKELADGHRRFTQPEEGTWVCGDPDQTRYHCYTIGPSVSPQNRAKEHLAYLAVFADEERIKEQAESQWEIYRSVWLPASDSD